MTTARRIPADSGISREIPGAAFEVPPEARPVEPPTRPTPSPHAPPPAPPPPTQPRSPRRVGRTINADPIMFELLDDALRRIAVAVGTDVQRSACYEAMWVVAIRHLDEVVRIVASDPSGRAIAASFAAELRGATTDEREGKFRQTGPSIDTSGT